MYTAQTNEMCVYVYKGGNCGIKTNNKCLKFADLVIVI